MSLEGSFRDTDQAIMAAARSERPVLSQALAREMVIVYFPVSVDEVYSVTWIGCIPRCYCLCRRPRHPQCGFQNCISDSIILAE